MLPELFLERMKNMLGADYEKFVESFSQEKYQALRVNTLKAEGVELPFHVTKVPWTTNGYYYEREDQPGKHPYHEAGVYYIQEPSAMAPVSLLGVEPGMRVLDLCAAPGGKSTQIAALLDGDGLLVCNEIHPARAKILSENVERMGIRNACVTNETPAHLSQIFVEYFDRILVDAPCSGEGMFRKNEDACTEWSLENVELCAERQDEILDCAAEMLRAGGKLVFSTCTFAPAENEGSISRFLSRHPEFHIVPIDKVALGIVADTQDHSADGVAAWTENPAKGIEGTLRLWPQHLKGEGHYAAVLQKDGEEECEFKLESRNGIEKGISEKELGEYLTFAKETLHEPLSGKYIKFGDNIYLVPEDMPGLKGLKVMRAGLQLGTMKKNRFEPSHALALAVSSSQVKHVWNLNSKENMITSYLNGQTFSAEGEKGWYLITVDGYSIGWGKLAGGIMKNHYPKGLRIQY